MLFANALAFDDVGNLFVTESFSGMEGDIPLGAIWKITPDGVAEKWIENTTLGGRTEPLRPQQPERGERYRLP